MKVRTALDHIQNHFREKLTVDAVAAAVGLSASRLSHLVKQYTGRTVLQIVQQMRIQHARHLLERSSMSCTEIAYEVGFNDQSYFTKHFKRLTGTTPARYRASR
jgi:AraC-like DNA-binding protein